jgi:hypothetical protein
MAAVQGYEHFEFQHRIKKLIQQTYAPLSTDLYTWIQFRHKFLWSIPVKICFARHSNMFCLTLQWLMRFQVLYALMPFFVWTGNVKRISFFPQKNSTGELWIFFCQENEIAKNWLIIGFDYVNGTLWTLCSDFRPPIESEKRTQCIEIDMNLHHQKKE